jgi:hypothetical protein
MEFLRLKEKIDSLRLEASDWCSGKIWYARIPFLIWFAYVLARHLNNPEYSSILGSLNLGIHEFGHFVFSSFWMFLRVAGGTIIECAVPIFGVFNFYRQRDFFSIGLCFGWLSTSLFDVARYVADARAMNLPLVSPFGSEGTVHDWNYILSRLGLLQFDIAIAFFIKCTAVASMLICLGLGSWLILQMKKSSSE